MSIESSEQQSDPLVGSTISVRGIAVLVSNTKSSSVCNILAAAGLGICALISFYSTWFYMRMSELGHQFGWGHVPLTEFPIPPASIEETFDTLGWIQNIGFVGGGIAFLFSMSKIRNGVEELIGKPAFFYGWGWTIGSLFIPIVCLYRPWVGFAEIRRAVRGMAARNRISL